MEAPKGRKISRFFFPLRHCFILSFSLPPVFSWNFGGVIEAPGPSNVHVWSSRSCESPVAPKPLDDSHGQNGLIRSGTSGVGQKWCGPNVVEKQKMEKNKSKKEISLSRSPQTKKNLKNRKKHHQNQNKMEKMLKERKSNQNIAQTRKNKNKYKKSENSSALSYSSPLL